MPAEGNRPVEAPTSGEQELRLLVETIPTLVWRAGPEGNIDYVNKRVLEYLGKPLGEIIGWGWMESVHPDDVAFKVNTWLKNLESETPHDVACRFRGADGQFRWFEVRAEPLRASDGRVLSWYGVLIDIDDRRKLQATLNVIPAHAWYAAPSGALTFVNKPTADYLGLSKDHPLRFGIDIGAQWDAHIPFLHPEDQEGARKAWPVNIRTGEASEYSFRVRNAEGGYRWFLSRVEPLRASDGTLLQWVGVNIDIDEAKKAEDLLRRSEAHLAEAQRLSHTGAVAYNGTAILFASEETYHIWGFDPAQGLPSREVVFQRIHPGDRDRLNAEVRRAVAEKKRYSIAYRILLPDGSVKHLETIGQPAFSASGELVEIFATQTDVTERKRAEEAWRESEGKFRDFAETASDWFWEIDPDYKFTLLTENAFGSDPAGRIGTACWDHALDLETDPEKWRLIWATLESRQPFRDFVYCSMGAAGFPMYVKASGKPVFDANGEFRGYRGTGTDVTATVRAQEAQERLRQLESDLAHMNRLSMMGELAASLAHEITQPMATARNNARAALNFLDKQPPDLGEVREAVDCVVGDTDRAAVIIGRIRDQIKKAPPRKHRFDLNEAISEVIVLAQSAIAENGVSVQTRLSEGLAPAEGDRVQLQQVILNLILNAAEAMAAIDNAARDLLISSEPSRTNGILVTVHDSGPGIDPEHFERVFDAFYTTKPSGMGMGLAICRSIIDAHGGRLWADANEPRGAAFQFTLPGSERSS
jgi:PAS domain S-box-containing protein